MRSKVADPAPLYGHNGGAKGAVRYEYDCVCNRWYRSMSRFETRARVL